ncbi:hypothetical protein R5W60_05605 [Brucella pseudintermedia]|uniref:hypothetical protein n=1 Tax=Brucella pseudintermedia TaxID=370111 RepID=UPI0028AD3DD4|nr:hypothetical protein [Brucella intermedia]WPM81169.1 hypothetical protein R5W60_05605 [Brucella pseudintermedia]
MEMVKATELHELVHRLELQRQYLDFLANSVEYLSQELAKVAAHFSHTAKSDCNWLGTEKEIAHPVRPAQLGEAPTWVRTVPYSYGHSFHHQSKIHNSSDWAIRG